MARLEHQLHAQVVDPAFLEFDERELVGDGAGAFEKQAVAQPHHVGLVAKRDAVPALAAGIFESEAHDSLGGRPRHDPQTFHDAGDDFVLLTGIKSLGVFAHDDKIDAAIGALNSG